MIKVTNPDLVSVFPFVFALYKIDERSDERFDQPGQRSLSIVHVEIRKMNEAYRHYCGGHVPGILWGFRDPPFKGSFLALV